MERKIPCMICVLPQGLTDIGAIHDHTLPRPPAAGYAYFVTLQASYPAVNVQPVGSTGFGTVHMKSRRTNGVDVQLGKIHSVNSLCCVGRRNIRFLSRILNSMGFFAPQ